uniref:Uncharacterized protein n=1 Tax=Sander lucioperca TaxID=283035 RepID=A0A8C9XTX8_SANLU
VQQYTFRLKPMQRSVSSLSLSPSVKMKLVNAGFQFTADLLHLKPLQLSKGNRHSLTKFRSK